jgi:muconate cycloisomerase
MKIVDLSVHVVRLPFRFSFKHSLASRDRSDNVIVAATMEHEGRYFVGYGESIPRDYVTGEDAQSAARAIKEEYAQRFVGKGYPAAGHLHAHLRQEFLDLQLDRKMKGASWCALELALLDAASLCENVSLAESVGHVLPQHRDGIRYGAVIPFGKKRAFTAVLWFYKAFGFKTIKIKVGTDFDGDLERVKLARQVLGPDVILRADANCAWTADEAIQRAEAFRPYGIASYEQPVAADDLAGLAKVSHAIPELVLADESLCSIEQARTLAHEGICTAFNIRISKVGGFFAAREIADIAKQHGIARHLGAQVGESGILSAAGRSFASTQELFDNYEGSNNFFLLQRDLTRENLNVGYGGIGKLLGAPGLGVTVLPSRLNALALETTSAAGALVTTNQTA